MSGPAGALFPANEAVPHHQLARAVVHSVPDTTTFLAAGIAIDGAKDHLHLGGRRSVEDATTCPAELYYPRWCC